MIRQAPAQAATYGRQVRDVRELGPLGVVQPVVGCSDQVSQYQLARSPVRAR
jgi:hypothetical protein